MLMRRRMAYSDRHLHRLIRRYIIHSSIFFHRSAQHSERHSRWYWRSAARNTSLSDCPPLIRYCQFFLFRLTPTLIFHFIWIYCRLCISFDELIHELRDYMSWIGVVHTKSSLYGLRLGSLLIDIMLFMSLADGGEPLDSFRIDA